MLGIQSVERVVGSRVALHRSDGNRRGDGARVVVERVAVWVRFGFVVIDVRRRRPQINANPILFDSAECVAFDF